MLCGLYASTFFYNVLFYMAMLKAIPEDTLIFYNAAFMGLCSLGFILYGFLHPRLGLAGQQRALWGSILLSGTGGILLYSTTGRHLFIIPALLLFSLSFGYLAAHIARLAAANIPVKKQGFFVGTALFLANFFLYFALLLEDTQQIMPFLCACALACVLLRRAAPLKVAAPDLPHADCIGSHLKLAVLIAVMLGTLVGLDDSIFIPHFAEYEASFFGISRLFTAAGFLLAGYLADRWPFYLPMIAIAAKSAPLFVRVGDSPSLLALLAYTDAFFTGALIVLVIRLFFFIAPYTTRPALWAGMGRGIELPASGLAAMLGTMYLEGANLTTIFAWHTAMLLICALLFYQTMLIYARTARTSPPVMPISAGLATCFPSDINSITSKELAISAASSLPLAHPQAAAPDIESTRKTYGLTDREVDVLNEVLHEKSIADIAAALFVTESTVKFHIGNLLKKTECKNQKELREKIKG